MDRMGHGLQVESRKYEEMRGEREEKWRQRDRARERKKERRVEW